MPPLPARAHAAGQAPSHSTPTAQHATPRYTAVLKLARSAPGSCSSRGSDLIRSARPGPVWVRTATPLPACRVPCQPASPLPITAFAYPASPGLPLSPSIHCCLPLLPLHPSAEPRKDGRAGRAPSRVRQTHPHTRACMPCHSCLRSWNLPAGCTVTLPNHPPLIPGAAARCSRLPPDPRPPPRPPFAHPNRPMTCTSPPPAPPVCILTGVSACPLPACCL